MNTDKVKNIVIGLLSAFIVLFLALIVLDERQFTLSSAHEENVLTILERNNISVSDAALIPRDFRPLNQMAIQRYTHDIDALVARFFGDADFAYDFEIGSTIYYCEITDKYMMHFVQDNEIIFGIVEGLFVGMSQEDFVKTAAAAEELARAFIHEIIDPYLEIELFSNDLTRRGDYALAFFASYRGHLLYDTQIRIRVTELGIVHATYSRVITGGFIGEPQPIFSADEALLSLLAHLRHEDIIHPANIIDIQLVYILQERGIPAYLFTLIIQDIQMDFLINAFTNTYIGSFSRN
jgi:hypothetical protein